MKKIIFLFYLISFIECIRITDYCYKLKGKEHKCKGKYYSNCNTNNVCAKNTLSCKNLILFSPNNHNNNNGFKAIRSQIKNCTEEWNSNEICLNSDNCSKHIGYGGRWSIQIKSNVCKCSGKYSHKCNGNYCSLDKRTCDGFNKNKSIKINKKCTNNKS
jgi:hypothetical protein